ncbi:hypothetical protein HN011_005901 [Eciton burchellii]|nr:hypothetical protein HN011_005901 [Eciton burchellii]
MIANETNVGFANRESVSIKASRPRLDQGYFQRAAYSEIDGAFGLSTAGNQSSFKLDRLIINVAVLELYFSKSLNTCTSASSRHRDVSRQSGADGAADSSSRVTHRAKVRCEIYELNVKSTRTDLQTCRLSLILAADLHGDS